MKITTTVLSSMMISFIVSAQPTVLFSTDVTSGINSVTRSIVIDTTATPDGSTAYSGWIDVEMRDNGFFGIVTVELDPTESIGTLELRTSGQDADNFVVLIVRGGVDVNENCDPNTPPLIGEVTRGTGSAGLILDILCVEQIGLPVAGWDRIEAGLISRIDTEPGPYSPGDMLADLVATSDSVLTANSSSGWIDRLFIAGDLRGDITVNQPGSTNIAVNRIIVDGQIGTPTDPVVMNLAGDLIDLRGDDVYAHIDLRYNGADGRLAFSDIGVFSDPTNGNMDGDFVGSLNALSPRSNINSPSLRGWFNVGVLDGVFVYGEGINPASSTPNPGPVPDRLGVGSIASTGQIIFNADNTGADWATDVEFADGTLIGPNRSQPYQAPYYEALPSTFGGGAIGLAPFNFHPKASVLLTPGSGSVQFLPGSTVVTTNPNTREIVIDHYGRVFASGAPLQIHRHVTGPLGDESSGRSAAL